MENRFLKFDTKRCFGVEIEVGKEIGRDTIIDFIKYRTNRFVKKSYYRPTINNHYWDVKHDGSCGSKFVNGINEGGYEINSYKASGVNDMKEIAWMISNLKKINVKVNNNCGFHLHVEVSDYDSENIGVLLNNWIFVENMIFSCVPNKRKSNKYCQKLGSQPLDAKEDLKKAIDFWNYYKPKTIALTNTDRKKALNIINFYRSISLKKFNRKTVEFRFMESTLCEKNIKNWIRFLVNFVEFCKNRNKLLFNRGLIRENIITVEDFLEVVGLGSNLRGFTLSEGLTETRKWVLQRLARHGENLVIKNEAKTLLKKESK